MRLRAHSFPVSKNHSVLQVMCQHTGAWQARQLKKVLDCFDLTDGSLLRMSTNTGSSNYMRTRESQTTIQTSAIKWPALRYHIPRMAQIIQLGLGAFMSSLGVKGHTQYWDAHELDQQFGENESTDIGKSQRLRKEGNARIN